MIPYLVFHVVAVPHLQPRYKAPEFCVVLLFPGRSHLCHMFRNVKSSNGNSPTKNNQCRLHANGVLM